MGREGGRNKNIVLSRDGCDDDMSFKQVDKAVQQLMSYYESKFESMGLCPAAEQKQKCATDGRRLSEQEVKFKKDMKHIFG